MQNELTFMYLELDTTPAMIYGMLEEMQKKDATRSHAMTALSLGDTARSRSILDTLSMEQRGDSLFADIVSYAVAAAEAGGSLKDIDSTGRAALYAYAQDTLPEAAWARSHYEIATDLPLRRPEEQWSSNKRGRQRKKEEKRYSLGDNIPNPFEGSTRIPYRVPEGAEARLIISNSEGKVILNIALGSARRSIDINCKKLPAGIYFYSLISDGDKKDTKMMTVIK